MRLSLASNSSKSAQLVLIETGDHELRHKGLPYLGQPIAEGFRLNVEEDSLSFAYSDRSESATAKH